jgi:anti-sigma factor RsiW
VNLGCLRDRTGRSCATYYGLGSLKEALTRVTSMSEPADPHVEVAIYLLGTLELNEADAFAAHLSTCANCRHQVGELRGVPDLLARAAPATPPPEGLRRRTLAAVRHAAAQR